MCVCVGGAAAAAAAVPHCRHRRQAIRSTPKPKLCWGQRMRRPAPPLQPHPTDLMRAYDVPVASVMAATTVLPPTCMHRACVAAASCWEGSRKRALLPAVPSYQTAAAQRPQMGATKQEGERLKGNRLEAERPCRRTSSHSALPQARSRGQSCQRGGRPLWPARRVDPAPARSGSS